MWRKVLAITFGLVLAFTILIISILRSAAVKYEFSEITGDETRISEDEVYIPYNFAYSGDVLPDSPLWPLKAARDRIWFLITTNSERRAELNLLFADKRIAAALVLFDTGKPEEGYSTLIRAEKYLEEAAKMEEENRQKGIDTAEFARRLAWASLKHYQVLQEIIEKAPDDAKPEIIRYEYIPKNVYNKSIQVLSGAGLTAPENPFDWD